MDTEGNKFTGALMSAKKNGKDHFMVSGKKYMVKEVSQCMSAQKMKELEADYIKSQKELEKRCILQIGDNMNIFHESKKVLDKDGKVNPFFPLRKTKTYWSRNISVFQKTQTHWYKQ